MTKYVNINYMRIIAKHYLFNNNICKKSLYNKYDKKITFEM